MALGKKNWIIPDCELPAEGEGVLKGLESVIVVNDNEKDVKDYLSLVNQVPELFTQILDFEQERRNAGIISPSFVISDTIDQIDQFLNASEENNLLIQSFEERLAEVESLSKDQKASYIANNRLLVTDKVFPAYNYTFFVHHMWNMSVLPKIKPASYFVTDTQAVHSISFLVLSVLVIDL